MQGTVQVTRSAEDSRAEEKEGEERERVEVAFEDEEGDDEEESEEEVDEDAAPAWVPSDAYGQRKDTWWLKGKLAGDYSTVAFPSPPPPLTPLQWPFPIPPAASPSSAPSAQSADVATPPSSPPASRAWPRTSSLAPFPESLDSTIRKALPTETRGHSEWCNPDRFNCWHVELINYFGELGGFSLLLSALPPAPQTTHNFLVTPPQSAMSEAIVSAAERLAAQTEARPPLANVTHLLNVLDWVVMPRLQHRLCIALYLLLLPRVLHYFLTLTDAQLQREPKAAISEVVSRVAILSSHQSVQSVLPVLSHVERFEADFALHLLRCPSLEKRIHGLSHLKKFIDSAHPKSPTASPSRRPLMDHFHSLHQLPPASPFLSLPSFPAYLQRSGLLETLFGDTLHVQLLRRAVHILRVMSQYGCVSPQQVELMWSASRGKHETVSTQVHACLMVVVSHLDDSALSFLLDRLKAVPLHEMDVQVVTLVRAVVWAGLGGVRGEEEGDVERLRFVPTSDGQMAEEDEEERRREGGEVSRRGLELLWQLFNSRQPTLNQLRGDVFHHLKCVLLTAPTARVRQRFMLRCLENLQSKWNVPYSLWLLSDLIDTFAPQSPSASNASPASPFKMFMTHAVSAVSGTSPAFGAAVVGGTPVRRGAGGGGGGGGGAGGGGGGLSAAEDERAAVLEWLNVDNRLVNAFFREVAVFSAHISASVSTSPSSSASLFPYPVPKQFEMRLIFLDFLYKHCPSIRFNFEAMAILWSHFISPLPQPQPAALTATQPPLPTPSPPTAFDSDARDILFCFLQSVFASPMTDPSVAPLVFAQLMPLLPFSSLSPQGFAFFQILFTSINCGEGKVAVTSSLSAPLTHSVRVPPSSLSGFDWLWEVACTCVHEEVSVEAMKLLQQLHVQVDASALAGMNDSYELCVHKAMSRIGLLAAQMETASDGGVDGGGRGGQRLAMEKEVERYFHLLNLFLDQPHYQPTVPPTATVPVTGPALSPAASPAPTLPWDASKSLSPPPFERPVGGPLDVSDLFSAPPQHPPAVLEVNVSYARSTTAVGAVEYGIMQCRVHSHATVDELKALITALSMLSPELTRVSHPVPFPFPLMELWRDGSALIYPDQSGQRLEALVGEPPQAFLDVRMVVHERPGGGECAPCTGCGVQIPVWVTLCSHCHQSQGAEHRRAALLDSRASIYQALMRSVHSEVESSRWPLLLSAVDAMRAKAELPAGLSDLANALSVDGFSLFTSGKPWPSVDDTRAGREKGQRMDDVGTTNGALTIVLRKDRGDGMGFVAGEKGDRGDVHPPLAAPAAVEAASMEGVEGASGEGGRGGAAAVAAVHVVHPSVILSRAEYFDALFDLLSVASNTALSEKCWQLIMRLGDSLPMRTRLQSLTTPPPSQSSPLKRSRLHSSSDSLAFSTAALSVDDSASVQWELLLDPHNLAKLQYSLMIVHTLMDRGPRRGDAAPASEDVPGERKGRATLRVEVEPGAEAPSKASLVREGNEWEKRFVAKGGLQHLLAILQKNDFCAALPPRDGLAVVVGRSASRPSPDLPPVAGPAVPHLAHRHHHLPHPSHPPASDSGRRRLCGSRLGRPLPAVSGLCSSSAQRGRGDVLRSPQAEGGRCERRRPSADAVGAEAHEVHGCGRQWAGRHGQRPGGAHPVAGSDVRPSVQRRAAAVGAAAAGALRLPAPVPAVRLLLRVLVVAQLRCGGDFAGSDGRSDR